jgi:hypothetical protein
MEDMYGWMGDILRAAGAEILPHGKYLEPLGDATHECGAARARMGTNPRSFDRSFSTLAARCKLDVKFRRST